MDVNGSQPLRTALSAEVARIRLAEHGHTEIVTVGAKQVRVCRYCRATWPCHMVTDAIRVLTKPTTLDPTGGDHR